MKIKVLRNPRIFFFMKLSLIKRLIKKDFKNKLEKA